MAAFTYGVGLFCLRKNVASASGDRNHTSDGENERLGPESWANSDTAAGWIRQRSNGPTHAAVELPGLRGPIVLEKAQRLIDTRWRAELDDEQHVTQALSALRLPSESPKLYSSPWDLEVVVDFCPWLTKEDKASYPPYYLWDVQQSLTVETGNLETKPEYLAVSHTWGRWMKSDLPLVKIPGVQWPVPPNSKFDVSRIPDELGTIGRRLNCRYVWFDLVCIPQVDDDCPDFGWGAIKRREIGRQASVFSSAKHAVAWLNDIQSFEGIRKAAVWQAIHLLESPLASKEDDYSLRANSWDAARDLPGFLWESTTDTINGWLESLWTLQEVILRPDMYLGGRNWNLLSLLENRVPLRIDRLVALFGSRRVDSAPPVPEAGRSPTIVTCLSAAFTYSGLGELTNLSPLSILFLGDRRYCKNNRADAIVSVTGAVTWTPALTGPESELVLGKYPLGFVTAVREKLGALFFAVYCWDGLSSEQSIPSTSTTVHMGNGILQANSNPWPQTKQMRPTACGSLMPFGFSGIAFRHRFELENSRLRGHSSVETWKAHRDGSTSIQEAVILSSPLSGSDTNWKKTSHRCEAKLGP